jgi:hypothetical protein
MSFFPPAMGGLRRNAVRRGRIRRSLPRLPSSPGLEGYPVTGHRGAEVTGVQQGAREHRLSLTVFGVEQAAVPVSDRHTGGDPVGMRLRERLC